VARHVRNARFPATPQVAAPLSSIKRPWRPPSERQVLLARLNRLAKEHADLSPGLRYISLDTSGFFDDDGADSADWIATRNLAHQQSISLATSARSQPPRDTADQWSALVTRPRLARHAIRDNDTLQTCGTRVSSLTVALRSASGSISRVDCAWRSVVNDLSASSDPALLSAGVSAYLACGWRGNSHALDALAWWLDTHAHDRAEIAASLTHSPTRVALLLTSATSALAASASSSPHRALETYDALMSLPVRAFLTSIPLSGALFKILRHARLPLHFTVARIDEVREQHVQLDEQSFSLALAAILKSSAPAIEKWAFAQLWLGKMRAAGMPLTVHTYNAFAAQLRFVNDPEMATSLLRDMAEAGVAPSALTYSLMFDSCVIPGPYTAQSRRRALSTNVLLRMLRVIENSMSLAAIPHSTASRLSLARAYAHLGETSIALKCFDEYEVMLSTTAEEVHTNALQDNEVTNDDDAARACHERFAPHRNLSSPFHAQKVYNQMIYSFAHCRCLTPAEPAAAFRMYDRMRDVNIRPNALTLEALLSACVRVGDTDRAIGYATEFAAMQTQTSEPFLLRPAGVDCLFTALSNAGTQDSWDACEPLLDRSIAELKVTALAQRHFHARDPRPFLSTKSIELAVLAFARRNNRGVAGRIISLTGICPADWEMALNGQCDFRRFRAARAARQRRQQGLEQVCERNEPDEFVNAVLNDDHHSVALT
jgi:hypothetical protein